MKYLKKFNTTTEYDQFRGGDRYVTPNVSWIVNSEREGVMFNPPTIPKVTLTYLATNDNLFAFKEINNIKAMKVDGKNIHFDPEVITDKEVFVPAVDDWSYYTKDIDFPDEYLLPENTSQLTIRLKDSSLNIDENNWDYYKAYNICLFVKTDEKKYWEYIDMRYDGYRWFEVIDNQLVAKSQFFYDLQEAFSIGEQWGIGVLDSHDGSSQSFLIDSFVTFQTKTGGAPTFYGFNAPGQHTIELSLTSDVFGAEQIADYNGSTTLVSVKFNNYVNEIASSTFRYADSLKSVDLGKGIKIIGENAFEYTSISSVILPPNIEQLGINTFSGTLIDHINIPGSVRVIPDTCFYNCRSLSNVIMNEGIEEIGYQAFANTMLSNIVFPQSLRKLNDQVFNGCNVTGDLFIPKNVEYIGNGFAYHNGSWNNIVVDSNNSVYDSRENCNCIIETSTNTLVLGGNNAFIPDSITKIGFCAFSWCSFDSIVVPDSVEYIDRGFNMANISSIILGSGVKTLTGYTFSGCYNLKEIICYAKTPPTIGSNCFLGVPSKGILKVPTNSSYGSWIGSGTTKLNNWTIQYI